MSAYSVSAHGLAIRKVPQGVLDTVNQLLFDAGQVGGNLSFTDFSKIWQDSAGTTPYTTVEQYVGKIIDKSPNALAFTQAVSAARPAVSRRVNLLTETEFRGGNANLTVAFNVTASALDGYLGAIAVGAGAASAYKSMFSAANVSHVISAVVEMDDGLPPSFSGPTPSDSANDFVFVLMNNLATPVNAYEVIPLGGSRYRVSATFTPPTAANGNTGILKYAGNSARTFKFTALDVRLATDAHLPYQRINTATDYATAGFPHYLKFDGIDDNLVSAAGGGGTAGIYYCGAVRFNKVGAAQTLFSDAGTNSGYKLQLTAANQLQISAGNGTAFTAVNTTATFTANPVSLVELWDDGTNIGVRLGEGTPVTVARPVVAAGTAQITIGKDNNAASGYAGINMFEPVWRYGAMPNATQREAIRATCRAKAGIV